MKKSLLLVLALGFLGAFALPSISQAVVMDDNKTAMDGGDGWGCVVIDNGQNSYDQVTVETDSYVTLPDGTVVRVE